MDDNLIELPAGIKIDKEVWAKGVALLLTRAIDGITGQRGPADAIEMLLADIFIAHQQLTTQSHCD